MPRTYPVSKKEKWLKQLAQGKSPKQVAKDSGCDPRTVKRAVQEIRSKSAAQEALTQLYREALSNHMNGLIAALDMVIKKLGLPEVYRSEIAWSQIEPSSTFSQYDTEDGQIEASLSGEANDPFSDQALLAEHLRNSKAWRALLDWHRSYKKLRLARGRLQIKTLSALSEKTCIEAYSEGTATSALMIHAEDIGEMFCHAVIKYLVIKETTTSLEKEIVVDKAGGSVRYHNMVLAEGFKEPQKASDCRIKILESFEILKESLESQQVLNTFEQLEKNLPKTRNELLAIRLLGVLPGQCRICRQFGL